MNDQFIHLTNYSINKNSEDFIFNKNVEDENVGHKRSVKYVFQYLKEENVNTDKLWREIKNIIIKTFCSA